MDFILFNCFFVLLMNFSKCNKSKTGNVVCLIFLLISQQYANIHAVSELCWIMLCFLKQKPKIDQIRYHLKPVVTNPCIYDGAKASPDRNPNGVYLHFTTPSYSDKPFEVLRGAAGGVHLLQIPKQVCLQEPLLPHMTNNLYTPTHLRFVKTLFDR